MNDTGPRPRETGGKGFLWRRGAGVLAVLILGYFGYTEIHGYFLDRTLVAASPDQIPADSTLLNYANAVGKSAYESHCVTCHGADMKGDARKGVPNLTDNIWLYDYGRVSDIERTVMYGIRSGLGKTHNVTDMPAIGLQRALNPAEINDVIAYVFSISKDPALHKEKQDPAAVDRGFKLFQDKGVCYDCHSRDATGIPDYGAPNLIDSDWLYGGDKATIYRSVYYGRHGVCPAWIDKMSFATIRALAVYIHSMSKESPESPLRSAAGAGGSRSG